VVQLQREKNTTDEPRSMATNEQPDAESYELPGESPSRPDERAEQRSTAALDARGEGAVGGSGGDGAVGGSGGDPLPEALRDSDGSVRRAAVEAIGRRNNPADTPLLLKCLSDPDDIVRLEAMYA